MAYWFDTSTGWPAVIRSDGGPQFRGDFDEFCKRMDIVHELSSAYNANSNGLAEAAVKSVKHLLLKCLQANEDFPAALLEFRNTPRADGFSPAQMFLGRRQRTRLPTLPVHHEQIDLAAAIAAREQTIREAADNFNRTAKTLPDLQPGQEVVVQDPKTKRWTMQAAVVEKRPQGNSYILDPADGTRTTIRNRADIRPVPQQEVADAALPEVAHSPPHSHSFMPHSSQEHSSQDAAVFPPLASQELRKDTALAADDDQQQQSQPPLRRSQRIKDAEAAKALQSTADFPPLQSPTRPAFFSTYSPWAPATPSSSTTTTTTPQSTPATASSSASRAACTSSSCMSAPSSTAPDYWW